VTLGGEKPGICRSENKQGRGGRETTIGAEKNQKRRGLETDLPEKSPWEPLSTHPHQVRKRPAAGGCSAGKKKKLALH